MTRHLISVPPIDDSGSEGGIGYDYQRDIALMLAIEMLRDRGTEHIICEFHQDIVKMEKHGEIQLTQIKKSEIKAWTLNRLITPNKKHGQGILANLFLPLEMGKNVTELNLWGFGRVSKHNPKKQFQLTELISLLATPKVNRDLAWHERFSAYEKHLCQELIKQQISPNTVSTGLKRLNINFGFPSPHTIHDRCLDLLEDVLLEVWEIRLNRSEIKTISSDIFHRIRQISNQPNLSWDRKALSRNEVKQIIINRLRNYRPGRNVEFAMTLQDKLTSVGLQDKAYDALQARLDAMVKRYELNISSEQWEDFKIEIGKKCRKYRQGHPNVQGIHLWEQMLKIFQDMSEVWQEYDSSLNRHFFKGVFFDMTGVCEAAWLRKGVN
ncbi:MAG: dsDNA nuclease domain-containing protein [Chloroflexota bacterium]